MLSVLLTTGLVEGYSSENEQLEQKIQDLEEQKETLVLELETTKNRLLDMAAVREENETMKREVAGQQHLMKQNVGEEAQGLRRYHNCQYVLVPIGVAIGCYLLHDYFNQ